MARNWQVSALVQQEKYNFCCISVRILPPLCFDQRWQGTHRWQLLFHRKQIIYFVSLSWYCHLCVSIMGGRELTGGNSCSTGNKLIILVSLSGYCHLCVTIMGGRELTGGNSCSTERRKKFIVLLSLSGYCHLCVSIRGGREPICCNSLSTGE